MEVSLYSSLYSSELDSFYDSFFSKESTEIPLEGELLKEDFWHFEWFWSQVARKYKTAETLYEAIREKQGEIRSIKEKFKPHTHPPISGPIDHSQLEPIEDGISGSYFFLDEQGNRRFVIKPLDEDIGCLNNPKGFSSPFDKSPFQRNLPLYRSSLREVLSYEVAHSIGLNVAPKTTLAILESDGFSDLSRRIDSAEKKRYLEECGKKDLEKLCSAQEYIPNAKSLFEALHEFQQMGLSDEEIAARFDKNDFEEANLLIWITYDSDAHSGNFLVYPKGVDAIGNEILGLKKIDNGFAFPEQNTCFQNILSHLPNAKLPPSDELKRKIAALDVEHLSQQLESYDLESAIPALQERIAHLQEIVKKPNITLQKINQKMR